MEFSDKKCPTGWKKFQRSCYYISAGKKNWNLSRDYCKSKGADLAIIKTQEEMVCFSQCINSLHDRKLLPSAAPGHFTYKLH